MPNQVIVVVDDSASLKTVQAALEQLQEPGVEIITGGDELNAETTTVRQPPMETRIQVLLASAAIQGLRLAIEDAKARGVEVEPHELVGRTMYDIPVPTIKDEEPERIALEREERQSTRQEWRDRNRAYERNMRTRGRR